MATIFARSVAAGERIRRHRSGFAGARRGARRGRGREAGGALERRDGGLRGRGGGVDDRGARGRRQWLGAGHLGGRESAVVVLAGGVQELGLREAAIGTLRSLGAGEW